MAGWGRRSFAYEATGSLAYLARRGRRGLTRLSVFWRSLNILLEWLLTLTLRQPRAAPHLADHLDFSSSPKRAFAFREQLHKIGDNVAQPVESRLASPTGAHPTQPGLAATRGCNLGALPSPDPHAGHALRAPQEESRALDSSACAETGQHRPSSHAASQLGGWTPRLQG